jgi:Cu/Ag efflux pump CusA
VPSVAKQSSPHARAGYLLVVLLGSYAVIWTFTSFAAVALSWLGTARSEAVIASSLLSFVLYPALVLVALATQRPLRLWGILAVVSLLLGALGRWGVS